MSDSEGPKKETVRITLPPRLKPSDSRESAPIWKRPAMAASAARGPQRPPPPGSPARAAYEAAQSIRPPEPAPLPTPAPVPPVRQPVSASTPPKLPPAFSAPAAPPPTATVVPAAPCVPASAVPPAMPPRPRVLPPPPRIAPRAPAAAAVSAAPAIYPGTSTVRIEPKKETARISILPQPAAPAMAKTQPLTTFPPTKVSAAPITTAASRSAVLPGFSWEAIPLPICWSICGISAVTLLIQIWNYFSV